MRRKRGLAPLIEVEPPTAAFRLSQLGGFAQYPVVTDGKGRLIRPDAPDLPVQKALRALMAAHREAPLATVDAYREAFTVLAEHGGEADFEMWKARTGGASCQWVTHLRTCPNKRIVTRRVA